MKKILLKDFILVDEYNERKSSILIADGAILEVGEDIDETLADEVYDGGGRLFAATGFFDMHVHFRDPGFTHKEDIITGASAALAGGFTGVACMPNTNPQVDSPEIVNYILEKAKPTGVNVCPIGCVTKGLNGKELCDYDTLKKAGAVAFSDDGKAVRNAEMLRLALHKSTENGMLIISHCEDMDIIGKGIINKGKISEKLDVAGMDRASEDSITAREIAIAACEDARIHIAHVSTKGSLALIRDAKNRGVKVTCETCPHYFTYTDEMLLTKDADYRMNPPLRQEDDRQAVIEAILDGTVDCIVTDHAPHTAEEKADFLTAPNGVVGLETSFAVTLTQLFHTGKASLSRIIELMSINPRLILGQKMPLLEKGEPANITIFDTEKTWQVVPEKLHSKSHNTVFKGEILKGKVVMTISDGVIRYKDL
ncbi:MAG: dihydroorotase [Oscillospiraceae bacterium]